MNEKEVDLDLSPGCELGQQLTVSFVSLIKNLFAFT